MPPSVLFDLPLDIAAGVTRGAARVAWRSLVHIYADAAVMEGPIHSPAVTAVENHGGSTMSGRAQPCQSFMNLA